MKVNRMKQLLLPFEKQKKPRQMTFRFSRFEDNPVPKPIVVVCGKNGSPKPIDKQGQKLNTLV